MTNNPPSPQAQYESLSLEERIEWFATEIMGWKKEIEPNRYRKEWEPENTITFVSIYDDDRKMIWCSCEDEKDFCYEDEVDYVWNPYKDWNHTMQVIHKVMEDDELWSEFWCEVCDAMGANDRHGEWLWKADQPTLMRAVLSVTRSYDE